MTDAPRPADSVNWLARYLAWRRRPDPAFARLQSAIDALEAATERAAVRRRVLEAERDAARAQVARLTAMLQCWVDSVDLSSGAFEEKYGKAIHDDPVSVARAALTDARGEGADG